MPESLNAGSGGAVASTGTGEQTRARSTISTRMRQAARAA
jgi:hypothetical protein